MGRSPVLGVARDGTARRERADWPGGLPTDGSSASENLGQSGLGDGRERGF